MTLRDQIEAILKSAVDVRAPYAVAIIDRIVLAIDETQDQERNLDAARYRYIREHYMVVVPLPNSIAEYSAEDLDRLVDEAMAREAAKL